MKYLGSVFSIIRLGVLFTALAMWGNSSIYGFQTETQGSNEPTARWWKGNLHTHSLWSDGNDFPEMISDWYRQKGYHFLAISDHNTLQSGQKWMEVEKVQSRSHGQAFEKYLSRFGKSWVETRGEPGSPRVSTQDLPNRERYFSKPWPWLPDCTFSTSIHFCETMENNLRAVLEQEKAKGREILPHLNHPNFKYGITFEDLAAVMAERFFEVYNGHPGVNHLGNAENPGIERMWDLANHLRVNKLGGSVLYGVGTDDSHEYHGKEGSRPGRGWVMVRAKFLTPEHLIRAMKAGDFYSSSGVSLKDVQWDNETKTLSVEIDPQDGVTYWTEYLVTDVDGEPEDIGRVGEATQQLRSSYTLKKGETIVRAVITSSLVPEDPVWKEQKQQAWTQPFTNNQ